MNTDNDKIQNNNVAEEKQKEFEINVQNPEEKRIEEFVENMSSKLLIRSESKGNEYDMSWFDKIFSIVPYINNIFSNLKTFLKEEEEILNVEKVKKVTVATVKHLSKHTEFVKEFDEEKNRVVPEKLLNVYMEDTLNTYENRFICSLIIDLEGFLYEIENKLKNDEAYNNNNFLYNGKSQMDTEDVDINFNIQAKQKKSKSQIIFNEKATKLKKNIDNWKSTELFNLFIKGKFPKVVNPLKRTNVILKNPDFQQAAILWDFIHGFELKAIESEKKEETIDKIEHGFSEYIKTSFMALYYIMMYSVTDNTLKKENYLKAYNNIVLDSFKVYLNEGFKNEKFSKFYITEIVNKEYETVKEKKVFDKDFLVKKINYNSEKFVSELNNMYFSLSNNFELIEDDNYENKSEYKDEDIIVRNRKEEKIDDETII